MPPCRQPQQLQGLEEIVGDDPYPEEDRISIGLTAGHPFHAKAANKLAQLSNLQPGLTAKLFTVIHGKDY